MKLERYDLVGKGNGCMKREVPLSSRYFVGVRKCRYPAATSWEWESAAIQLLLCGSEKVPLSSCYFVGVIKCRYPAATLWEWESAAIQLLLCGSDKVPLSSCYFVGVRKCRYPAATLWEWESAAIQLLLCGSEKVPLRGSQRGHTVTLVSKISLESYLVTLQQFFHKHKTVC